MKSREQERVTLLKVKYAAFNSRETPCFEATVLFDGKPACTARNEGNGGATFHESLKGQSRDEFAYAVAEMIAFAKTLEPEDGIDPNLEIVVFDLVDRYLVERDLARAFKKKVLYTASHKQGLYEVKLVTSTAEEVMAKMRAMQPDVTFTFLNELPMREATRYFLGGRP